MTSTYIYGPFGDQLLNYSTILLFLYIKLLTIFTKSSKLCLKHVLAYVQNNSETSIIYYIIMKDKEKQYFNKSTKKEMTINMSHCELLFDTLKLKS